jgi:hypothetical protein
MIKRLKQKVALVAALAVAGLLLSGSGVQAQDSLDFGFEVNSTQSSAGKRIFNYDAVSMTLSVVDNTTVDLTVNDTEFDNASFDFSATAGSTVESIVGTQTILNTPFSGTFSFFQAGSGTLILQVTFQDAILSAREGARNGALFQSDDGADSVQMILGAALGGIASLPPEGFSFALGGANPRFNNNEGENTSGQLQSFSAKSSFLADTSVIPEPSGFILTAFGMLGFAALRRRQQK